MRRPLVLAGGVLCAVALSAGTFALGTTVTKTKIMIPLACATYMDYAGDIIAIQARVVQGWEDFNALGMSNAVDDLEAWRVDYAVDVIATNQWCHTYPVEGD